LPTAEEALDRLIGELGVTGVERPEVLDRNSTSTAQAAEMLSAYAQRQGADLILVGSHGRTLLSRWLLGSFAETLLAKSNVPVMVVGQHIRTGVDRNRVLAPTDFGTHAKEIFKMTVGFARDLGAQITLYHAILRPITPIYQSGVYLLGSPWIPVREYIGRAKLRQERRLQGWADWAEHQGVETDSVVDIETANVADSILELARKQNAGWIVMGGESGPVASAFLGSIARRVVRGADCPVWVSRFPKQRSFSKRAA
jgi:nucleotide-binding universal stress UspA family protein